MNKREDFKQLVRYGVVGVANTLLTFVSYWIFRYITGNVDLANGVSYALGMQFPAQQAVDLQRGRWAVASRSLLLLRRFGFVLVCAVGVFPSEPPLCARNCGAVGRHGRLHLAGLCL